MGKHIKSKIADFFTIIKRKPKIVFSSCIAAIALIVAICIILFGGHKLPEAFAGEIDIKPAYASEYGIGTGQGFVITSVQPLTKELIETSLIIEPSFDYSMKREDEGKTWHIVPKEPLLANTVYQIGMDPEYALAGRAPRPESTWAFQTEVDFRLIGSIPAGKATDVPRDTVFRLTFTQAVDAKEADKQISVKPQISGKWESKGEQLTFIPKDNLNLDTVYTISIKSGLINQAGDASLPEGIEIQFQTTVEEEQQDHTWYQIGNDNNCFRTDEHPAFGYTIGYQSPTIENFDVEIYAFANESDYIEAFKSRQAAYNWCYDNRNKLVDTSKLNKLSSFSAKSSQERILRCPEVLKAGYYLAGFTGAGIQRQSLFQVTDLSGYLAAGDKDSLVWLNDLRSGEPVSGAKVSVIGTKLSAVTDKLGVAVISDMKEAKPILSIASGDNHLVMDGWNYWAGNEGPAINPYEYWYYLSTDRAIYRPGDTVNYFGIITPRDDKNKHFTEAQLVLNGGAYVEDSAIRGKVKIENGIISGSWQLPKLNTGWYTLAIEIDGQSFGYAGFEVAYYEKPAYHFTLQSKQRAAFVGEKVTWDIAANYFEGTPVAGLESIVHYDGNEKKIITDQDGKASITCEMTGSSWNYLTNSYTVSIMASMPELGDVSAYDSVIVFNQDIDIEGRVNRDKRSFDLHLDGYDIDLDKLGEDGSIWRGDYRSALSGNHNFQAKLTRIEYDKIEKGPFYNEYTLQTYYTYEYKRRETLEGSFDLTLTAAGTDYTGALQTDNAYELAITGKGHKGRAISRSYYIPGETQYAWNDYRYFYIEEVQKPGQYKYAVGDELRFLLKDGETQIPMPDHGNILYFRSQETIRDYTLSQDGAYRMQFAEKDIPNVNLAAVYFDGHYYVESAARYISVDPADKAVKVNIKTDKERYAPGETVNMSVDMTDKDGKPLSGTVNISLVDEALLSVSEQYVDIGSALFNNTYSFPYCGTVSHLPVENSSGGAEMGDGGGEREDFRDTALFETIKTDQKGHAELSFTLPDNITSWRVMWQGFAPGIYAGNGSENIDVSLDFFLDHRLVKTFLKGDMPKIGLRSAGLGINSLKSQTEYTVEIKSIHYLKTVSGTANTWQELALPELSEGQYKVKISAQNGNYKDAVNTEFSVIESFASYRHDDEVKLKKGIQLTGSEIYQTTLLFSEQAYTESLRGLFRLAGSSGVRLEQKLVAQIAGDLLSEEMKIEQFDSSQEDKEFARHEILKYQQGNGGIAAFTYASDDIETGVLAASIGKAYFDENALAGYFNAFMNREDVKQREKTLCLWGLAALNQPVLMDIQKTLEIPELSGEEKLNLTMALYYAGDGAKAKTLAQEILADYTEDLGSEARAKIDAGDQAKQAKATARLALLANVFDLPQAEKLTRYMQNNLYEGDPFLLEQMVICKNLLLRLPEEPAKFTYTLDGKEKTVDLREQTFYSLIVLPDQLKQISFSETGGDITVLSCYQKEGQPPKGQAAKGQLAFKRMINGSAGNVVIVSQQKPVLVTIEFTIAADAPNGCYTITDYLPAGLRFGSVSQSSRYVYPLSGTDGRKVAFGIYKGKYIPYAGDYYLDHYYQKDGSIKGKIVYTAYPAMTGTFKAESPWFGHSINDQILIHAPETKITIE